jgi:glycosyltransferase involved in cell wall biosynthesis
MPVISIITPVHPATAEFAGETYRSIAGQHLPSGWSVQWLVQADGPVDLRHLPEQPWISTGTGRPGGAARARTLALARATGVLLRQLDADDLLPDPLALARDIHILIDNPTIAWVVSPTLDLHPDGSTAPGPYDPAPGLLPPRTLLDGLLAERLPVMGTTVTLYTELARALGAWPALPYGQDVALCLNAEAVSAGWMQEQPGELYRRHPGQATLLRPAEERRIGRKALADQAQALRRTGWAYHPPVEDLGEDPGYAEEDWLRDPPIAS